MCFLLISAISLKPKRARISQQPKKTIQIRFLLQRKIKRHTAAIQCEDGNVESAMVLIPLLILFLIAFELIIATNLRNSDVALAQGEASRRAINGHIYESDEVVRLSSPDRFAHIRLLITHRRTTLPQIVPGLIALMGGLPSTDVRGVAIMEPIN